MCKSSVEACTVKACTGPAYFHSFVYDVGYLMIFQFLHDTYHIGSFFKKFENIKYFNHFSLPMFWFNMNNHHLDFCPMRPSYLITCAPLDFQRLMIDDILGYIHVSLSKKIANLMSMKENNFLLNNFYLLLAELPEGILYARYI